MNSLLRTVSYSSNKRNMLVRESLQQQLTITVMEMQSAPGVLEGKPVEICDEVLAMCACLEAIFLHGLKDSLLNRVTEALSGPDYDAMPQPSFWGPLLVISHRQIIDQIQGLSQLTTEVGYCRAWIRLALNEGLLTSYLAAIRRDNSAFKPYYNRAAFMRDSDLVEVAQRLVESIDYIHFDLASNSSLLNFWSRTPLLMAAIWSPPMKSCPVFSAIDIAKTINFERSEDTLEDIETASSIGSLSSFNSLQNTLFNGLTEDDALKIILAKNTIPDVAPKPKEQRPLLLKSSLKPLPIGETENGKFINGIFTVEAETAEEPMRFETENANDAETINRFKENAKDKININVADQIIESEATGTNFGNSLIGKQGWSAGLEGETSMTSSGISRTSATTDGAQSPNEGLTYDVLLRSYHYNYKSPNLEELLEKYPTYEPTTVAVIDTVEPRERQNFDEQLGRLSREKGLDLQNYNCLECETSIGLTFAKANVCSFTGDYFCSNCMASEEHLIPARVIHNWDLKRYPICLKASKYLNECTTLLDLKILNPRIYTAVDVMAQLQTLRVQLNLLRAYLFLCREPVIESFQKMLAPRNYLYEHIHKYSVTDFLDIPNGMLAQQLQKAVEFARNHVIGCWLCNQKGFICEVCNNPKVIYPFDTQVTYRCRSCNTVFHADCQNASKPCPKCERRRKRIDESLLDMGNPDMVNDTAISSLIATT